MTETERSSGQNCRCCFCIISQCVQTLIKLFAAQARLHSTYESHNQYKRGYTVRLSRVIITGEAHARMCSKNKNVQ